MLDPFLRNEEVEIVAVADVDDSQAAKAADTIAEKRDGRKPTTMRDYRAILDDPSINAVIIATPDHWHAQPTIQACQAGKDVYVEKPVAHNVLEGRAMVEAARKYNRVVAVGTQQRSSENFQKAVEAVRSGVLGKVTWVQTWNYENISPLGMGIHPDEPVPAGVDYDRWLGPASVRPFNRNRFHLLFRWFFEYAGGMMSDWGVHLNDIALWALDQKGPAGRQRLRRHLGRRGRPRHARHPPGRLRLPRAARSPTRCARATAWPSTATSYGILFCGTDGSLMLDRSGHQIIPDKVILPYGIKLVYGDIDIRKIDLEASEHKAKNDGTNEHVRNYLDCLKSREKPTTEIEIAHHSTNTTHLGNIAYKLGRKLYWDAENETFKNDPEANALLGREYRKGYELPAV